MSPSSTATSASPIADAPRPKSRKNRLALAAILLLATGLRFFHLGYQSVWIDEVFSLQVAEASLRDVMGRLLFDAVHPPLYYLLLHCVLLLGKSEVILRLPSAVLGVGVVWLTYLLARGVAGERVGLLSALLMAVSPFQVYYSQETRMYTLMALAATASLYTFWRAVSAGRGWGWWAAYPVTSALALYSHYMTAPVLLAEGVYVMTTSGGRRALGRWAVGIGVTALLYSPWILAMYFHAARPQPETLVGNLGFAGTLMPSTLLDYAFGYFQGLFRSELYLVVFLGSLMALLAWVCGLWQLARGERAAVLLSASVLLTLAAGFVVALKTCYHLPRYLMAGHPPAIILLAAGLVALWERRSALLPVAIGLLVFLNAASLLNVFSDYAYERDDWRAVARYLQGERKPDDFFVFSAAFEDLPLRYYYKEPFAKAGLPRDKFDPGGIEKDVAAIVANHRRIWLILCYDNVADPKGYIRAAFERHAHCEAARTFAGVKVYLYMTGAQGGSP